jgi:hypothetical protein
MNELATNLLLKLFWQDVIELARLLTCFGQNRFVIVLQYIHMRHYFLSPNTYDWCSELMFKLELSVKRVINGVNANQI